MMTTALPLWWLALPALLLPIWWHRQKRRQLKAMPLASARFLPPADPHQLRAWAWSDRLLLLVRCLLLVALIAWLAGTTLAWRGDTVFVDADADPAWAEQQVSAAGFKDATRRSFCAAPAACDIASASLFDWLGAHEHAWKPAARLLVIASGANVAMPARAPQLAHALELRVQPPKTPAAAAPQQVVVASTPERLALWRAMFAAFGSAGEGRQKYVVTDAPDAKTTLIVWDQPGMPPPAWHAALWWFTDAATDFAATPELANAPTLTMNGLSLKYADSPRGRLWRIDAPHDADGARAIYDTWQALQAALPAYAMPAQTLAPLKTAATMPADAESEPWLLVLLLALFCLERILTHARRN